MPESSGVGIRWPCEQLGCRCRFEDVTRVHDHDAIGHAGDNAEVVRDENHARAGLALSVRINSRICA